MNIRRRPFLIAVTALALVAALPGCKKKTADAFPATGAVSGWEKTGETRIFAAKDLYQYIDGDAEVYLSAGVLTTSTADYKFQGQLEAMVDVHTMGSPDGARKILENGATPQAKRVALGDGGMAYEQSVVFRKGVYLVRIVAYQSPAGTQQALMALAQGVSAKL